MNIDELKRLAGITDSHSRSTCPDPVKHSDVTAKPGTDEWFKQSFPLNDFQMPVGFRGRKK